MASRLLVLALIALAAQVDADDLPYADDLSWQASCGLYATDAALKIPDLGIWSMLVAGRCGSDSMMVEGMSHTDMALRCTIDVTGLAETLARIVNSVMKAVQHCAQGNKLNTPKAQCGMDASKLTESTAALTGAAAAMGAHCGRPDDSVTHSQSISSSNGKGKFNGMAVAGMCVINTKATLSSLIRMAMRAKQTADACKVKGETCTYRALQLTSSLADLGQYVLNSAGYCQEGEEVVCAGKFLKLAKALGDIAMVGKRMSKSCAGKDLEGIPRLYLEGDDDIQSSSGNFLSLALAALLPAVAVLSFVAGKKFARTGPPTSPVLELE